jgi:hypothetical protein
VANTGLEAADLVIEKLPSYAPVREKIAELFEEYLWNGVWDMTLDTERDDLPDLRFVQEDEYDQHMDDSEDSPDSELELCFVAGHYVFEC